MHMKKILITAATALIAGCAATIGTEPPLWLLGEASPNAPVVKTIVIKPDTRWVNVIGGETVKFVVGDKSFAWTFNGASSIRDFDLNRVAPAGTLDHRVTAYIGPDPRYIGGDGERNGGRR